MTGTNRVSAVNDNKGSASMNEFIKMINGAALAFFIGFWFAAGATLGVTAVAGFAGFGVDYIMVVEQPEGCEGGPCG